MSNKITTLLYRSNVGTIVLAIALIGMVITQIPPYVLDLLFSFSIASALIILMVSVYVVRPLDFSVFPTILLITTLLRLMLNIASTRVVLLHGNEGTHAAGKIIQAFGEVVIGGNFVVGLIVFSILIIINFIVVTKGAGRISEVSARFTLDAMPGKQMAIDADVGAGVLSQEEAKIMRRDLAREADFYGAMDGASKFVRGDAIASLLILLINLIGGITIGIFQHGMSFNSAAQTFSILTIGDGLVAQIPALLLSIAAAIVVTRVANEKNISDQTIEQLFQDPKPLLVSGIILTCIALLPNMPHLPLLSFAVLIFTMTYFFFRKPSPAHALESAQGEIKSTKPGESIDNDDEVGWQHVRLSDRITLEIGYGLIHLIGTNKDSTLINRIKGIRKKISQELGFLVPSIRVKDNLELSANNYAILIKGVRISETMVYPDKLLAISPGTSNTPLQGIACKEPTFGLDSFWITESQRDYAQGLGYTVVDLSTVITTHLNFLVRNNAAHLLGYGETQELINNLMETEPKLVESLTSGVSGVPFNTIVYVLQKLLQSGIPVIDFRTIAEKMVDSWSRIKDQETLVETVRVALKQLIVYSICGDSKELSVAVIDNELTQILLKSIQLNQAMNEKIIVIEPTLTDKLYNSLLEYIRTCELQSIPTILLLNNELRGVVEKLFKSSIPNLHFLSYSEIPDDKQIKIIQRIGR